MSKPHLDAIAKMTDLIEFFPFAVIIVTPEGEIAAANRVTVEMFRYSSNELVGSKIEVLLPQRLRNQHSDQRKTYAASPKTRPMGIGMDLIGSKKGGIEFPVEVALSTVGMSGGEFIMCFVSDISIRKQVEEENRRLMHQLQRALEDVRRLSGLLPICSSCKKIRDDAGHWTAIEDYIVDHSNTEFSHGICPECAERLYPQYFGKGN